MTTTPAGPAKPDPTQPILVGTARPAVPRPPQPVAQPAVRTPPGPPPAPPVPPAYPGTPVPPRRRPTGLIAVIVVLAVVVMGLGGVALRPYLGGTTGASTTPGRAPTTPGQTVPAHPSPSSTEPTPSQTAWGPYAGEVFVPYDLGADVPAGATPSIVGIWGDVAVFVVGDLPDPVTLVFVDVTDGHVTGTLRTTPDGAAFRLISAAADYHTLILEVSQAPYPGTVAADGTPVCPGTLSLLQVSLVAPGTPIQTGSWQPTCTPVDGGLSVAAPRLTAYRNGMVVMTDVVDVMTPQSSRIQQRTLAATEAYRETYLEEPVWRVEGTGSRSTYHGLGRGGSDVTKTNDDGLVPGLSPMLLDDWVMSATGEYVDLNTGEPTGWRIQTQTIPDFEIEVSGGRLYTATPGPGIAPTSVSLWSAPTDKAPVWTYTPTSGDAVWGNGANRPWSCQSDDIGIDRVVTGTREEGPVQMTAVDLVTGKTLWSRVDTALGRCAIVTVGDQEVIGLWSGSGVQFVDAITGQVTGPAIAWPGGVSTSDWTMALYPCGVELVCAVPGDSTTVTVASFSYAGGTAKIEGTVTLPDINDIRPWDAGSRYVLVGRDGSDHPCFVLL